jgi:TolB-like protein
MLAAVRQWLLVPVFSLVVTLLGASALIVGTPSVVVYPLIPNGSSVTKETGARISVTIATQIAQLGGITVKPAPPGIEQHDFLIAARKLGVDYYVTGYVTPLGNQASVVEQLVSTKSGSIVWSNTAQLETYGEAAGQGSVIRSAVLAYAGRAVSQLQPVTATPVPQVQPTPARLLAPKKVAVLALAGEDAPDRVAYAAKSMMKALAKNKVPVARSQNATQDAAQRAGSICAQTGATLLLGGSLAMQSANPNAATASVVVTGFNCAGAQVGQETASSDGAGKNAWQVAIDRAMATAVRDYLQTHAGS